MPAGSVQFHPERISRSRKQTGNLEPFFLLSLGPRSKLKASGPFRMFPLPNIVQLDKRPQTPSPSLDSSSHLSVVPHLRMNGAESHSCLAWCFALTNELDLDGNAAQQRGLAVVSTVSSVHHGRNCVSRWTILSCFVAQVRTEGCHAALTV